MILEDVIAGLLAVAFFALTFWALDTVHAALLAQHIAVR